MASLTILEVALVVVFVVVEFVAAMMLPKWIKAVARRLPH